MKRAVIIGGYGKVATYLAPMLLEEGYHVIAVSRGKSAPKMQGKAWEQVEGLVLDRSAPGFSQRIAALRAEVVVDMICFHNDSLRTLMNALTGSVGHYLLCGSAWIHGRSGAVPMEEKECRDPEDNYGCQKSAMDLAISEEYRKSGFPGTAVHPGHIVCPGDVPINPQGFKGLSAFEKLRAEEPVYLPNFGMETLHHVHAADVAGVFRAAIRAGNKAYGEGFHAVSPYAVTLYGYAKAAASWFGKEADLRYEPFEQWKNRFTPEEAATTQEHIWRSPNCSMKKAKRLLDFEPAYTTYQAVQDCLHSFGML